MSSKNGYSISWFLTLRGQRKNKKRRRAKRSNYEPDRVRQESFPISTERLGLSNY